MDNLGDNNFIKIRNKRTLASEGNFDKNYLTVFLGIHNGEKYLNDIFAQIDRQKTNNLNFLIVDNCSTDKSFEILLSKLQYFRYPFKLVRNPTNLGGGGSFALNADLINTKWIAFMHQDDSYLSHHFSILESVSRQAPKNVIAISPDMGSLSNDGKIRAAPPRGLSLLGNADAPTLFLANLKMHIVPWPATAFRVDVFLDCLPPWHSPAFPDTEMVLKLCARGIFWYLPIQTMRYRENMNSESHSIENNEKLLGAFISLCRIFSSKEFCDIANLVNLEDRESFTKASTSAILKRFEHSELGELLVEVKNEALIDAWGYGPNNLVSEIANFYKKSGSKNTETVLLEFLNQLDAQFVPAEIEISPNYSSESPVSEIKVQKQKRELLELYGKLGLFVPYSARRLFYFYVLNRVLKRNKLSAWNFNWK